MMRDTANRRITIERIYEASVEDVWDLWTTVEGIESWWGPEGFTTKVLKLDLRAGGELVYTMTATGPAQVQFMKNVGMPLSTQARITFREVVPPVRLAYVHLADFIPGIQPYDVETLVEFQAIDHQVRMILTFDPMHNEEWTQRAVMGHESQLVKLERAIKGIAS